MVGEAARLGCFDGQHRCERRVSIVGAATAVQSVPFDHRRPRSEPIAPSGHLGLFVEVTVEHDSVVVTGPTRCRHLDDDHRRASGQLVHGDGHSGHPARRAPGANQIDGSLHVAVLAPLRVEGDRDVRDGDVLVQSGNDLVDPHPVDVTRKLTPASHRRTDMIRSRVRSASAIIWATRSAAGMRPWIAPTP